MIKAILFSIATIALMAGPNTVSAQTQVADSTAKAPMLDAGLKNAIRSMPIINNMGMPKLDGPALVVTFFASWCPPCRPEFAELNIVQQAFSDSDVTMIAINLFEGNIPDDGGARMERFLDSTQPGFAVIQPDTDNVANLVFGGIDRIPTVYIYDRAGHPVFTFIHQQGATKMHTTAAEIIPHIRKAMSQSTQ